MAKITKKPNLKERDIQLENSTPYLVYQVTNALTQNFREELGSSLINTTEWRILSTLKSRGGQSTISELTVCTVIKQPIVSRIITEMEEKGIVRRVQSQQDLRVTNVQLTPAGEKVFEAILPAAIKHRELALKGFDNKEREAMKKMLYRMLANLGSKIS